MKGIKKFSPLIALLLMVFSNMANAQYDDLYYNPDTDGGSYNSSSSSNYDNNDYSDNDDDEDYDNDEYDYEDSEYGYSSRIRRFHRPYYGFDYYDPVYVDVAYYDPFWTPGNTVLIYDDYYSYRSWRRASRFGYAGFRPWYRPTIWFSYSNGYYNPWRSAFYDPWYGGNNYIVNNYYGGGYGGYGGYNNYGGGYGGYNVYCPPSWGNGYNYNTVSNVNNTTYYGSRRGSTTRPNEGNGRHPLPANTSDNSNTIRQNDDGRGGVQPGVLGNGTKETRRKEANEGRTTVQPGKVQEENSRNSRSTREVEPTRQPQVEQPTRNTREVEPSRQPQEQPSRKGRGGQDASETERSRPSYDAPKETPRNNRSLDNGNSRSRSENNTARPAPRSNDNRSMDNSRSNNRSSGGNTRMNNSPSRSSSGSSGGSTRSSGGGGSSKSSGGSSGGSSKKGRGN